MLDGARANGEQILPPAAVASLREGSDRKTLSEANYSLLRGWSYRSMWLVSHDDHGAFAARGVHGQTIWIDPTADMVIVRFASNPVAANAATDPTSLPAYRAVAEHLMANDPTPLLGAEWKIENLDDGVIDNSHATLQFSRDGHLSGSATCNRLIGSYKASGNSLSIEPVGTTMMACPEALMNLERKVLDLVPKLK